MRKYPSALPPGWRVPELALAIDGNTLVYPVDECPSAEERYRARFYFDPNGIAMGNYDTHNIFYGYNESLNILVIELHMYKDVYQVCARTLTDIGTWRISSFFPISDEEHYLEVDWQAASAEGADDGYLTFWIDGVERTSLAGIDNDMQRFERVALGR